VGAPARVTVPALGARTLDSEVGFIYPHLDPLTRRGEVRVELDNPDQRLRPEMWAEVTIQSATDEVLSVPASAVIDTGGRYVAFVRGADDHLEPREVEIGLKTDDDWQVLAGLGEGEQVVTRALFLVDSESQLKAAMAAMERGGPPTP
jgi:Cu(I)/Ag(I) efflux system membrane fusion protein